MTAPRPNPFTAAANDRIRKDAERLLTTHDLSETIWILSARTGKSADVVWLIIETVV